MAVEVKGNQASLYVNCSKVETLPLERSADGELDFTGEVKISPLAASESLDAPFDVRLTIIF